MNLIPVEIFDAIMTSLPLKQVVEYRLVSHDWSSYLNTIIVRTIVNHLTKKVLTGLVKHDPSILSEIEGQLNAKQLKHICACYAYLGDQAKVDYYLGKGVEWDLKCVTYALIGGNEHFLKRYGNPSGVNKIPVSEIMSSLDVINQRKKDYLYLIQNEIHDPMLIDWFKEKQNDYLDFGKISMVAIKNQALDILQFIGNKGYEFDFGDLLFIIKCGNLEMLHWILNQRSIVKVMNDVSNDGYFHAAAANTGNPEILQLLRSRSTNSKLFQKLHDGKYIDTKQDGLDKIEPIIDSIYATHVAALASHRTEILEYIKSELELGIPFNLQYYYAEKPNLNVFIKKIINDNNKEAINIIYKTYGLCALGHIKMLTIQLGNLNIVEHIESMAEYDQDYDQLLTSALMNKHLHLLDYYHRKLGHTFVAIIMRCFGQLIDYAIKNDIKIAADWLIKFKLSQMEITPDISFIFSFIITNFQKSRRTFCVSKLCYMNGMTVKHAKTNHKTIDHVINLIQSVLEK